MVPKIHRLALTLSMAALVTLTGCGTPSSEPEGAAVETEPTTTFEEQRDRFEAAIEQEITALEEDIGNLRTEADATDEDFTSEFVHLDQLMSEVRTRLDEARITSAAELERLRSDTRQQLDEIQEAFSDVQARVAAAEEQQPT